MFTNNGQIINELNFDFVVSGYMNENAGSAFDEGGILLKWGFPFLLNSGYPPVSSELPFTDIDKLDFYPNPANDMLLLE